MKYAQKVNTLQAVNADCVGAEKAFKIGYAGNCAACRERRL